MIFLIYGSNGWIGTKIMDLLMDHSVIKSKLRLDESLSIEQEIIDKKPDRIICCVGRINGYYNGEKINTIDYLEKPGKLKENIYDNLYSPVSLAIICNKLGIHMTYIGSGCIFTYSDEKKTFGENDIPNFFGSSYSTVKGCTDMFMHLFPDTVLNVRIRMPITSDNSPQNLIMKLLKYKNICSISNSMTVLDELLPILYLMICNKEVGTINLVNPGTINHQEILDLWSEIKKEKVEYNLISYEEQSKLLNNGRSNNELKTSDIIFKYGKIRDIKTAIEETIKNMN